MLMGTFSTDCCRRVAVTTTSSKRDPSSTALVASDAGAVTAGDVAGGESAATATIGAASIPITQDSDMTFIIPPAVFPICGLDYVRHPPNNKDD